MATTNLFPGLTARAAKPGDIPLLFGTGVVPTDPPAPTGETVSQPAALKDVIVTVGSLTAQVSFAGPVSSGLYRINVTVPALPSGAYITVQK